MSKVRWLTWRGGGGGGQGDGGGGTAQGKAGTNMEPSCTTAGPGLGATDQNLPWVQNHSSLAQQSRETRGNWISDTALGRLCLRLCPLRPFPSEPHPSSTTNPCPPPPLVPVQTPPCSLRLQPPLTLTARGPFSQAWPCSHLLTPLGSLVPLDTAHIRALKALCDLGPA